MNTRDPTSENISQVSGNCCQKRASHRVICFADCLSERGGGGGYHSHCCSVVAGLHPNFCFFVFCLFDLIDLIDCLNE